MIMKWTSLCFNSKETDFLSGIAVCGREAWQKTLDLGAVAIVERGLGDDQHPSGYNYVLVSI